MTESTLDVSSLRLEREFVHDVYDNIADHFSRTRYKPWPRVERFVDSLSIGSLLLDVGCGNGKYMTIRKTNELAVIGCDRSQSLLQICRQKQLESVVSDCLNLSSFRPQFDAILCVAVLHHLSTEERRRKAIQQIIDCLSIGGKALITVWAFEQNKNGSQSHYIRKESQKEPQIHSKTGLCLHVGGTAFTDQEVLVPFANKTHLRYYHVFREGELEGLVSGIKSAELEEVFYESGNHGIVLTKTRFIQ
ncbi:alkylated DNA repair protein alkB homolog 8-like [Oppia nitens]|uniref:alkylated DNA repair protein alkB homolog 8-like n=1 Tax=Oppia nitens TaxID=1686743 RepID=UPI0023DA1032|nr:alkylated DNA repair protein alkB homolog 8-like [Oppia nitens]